MDQIFAAILSRLISCPHDSSVSVLGTRAGRRAMQVSKTAPAESLSRVLRRILSKAQLLLTQPKFMTLSMTLWCRESSRFDNYLIQRLRGIFQNYAGTMPLWHACPTAEPYRGMTVICRRALRKRTPAGGRRSFWDNKA
jgi:hypothetical protein